MDRRPREAEVLVRTEALTKRFGTTLALDSVDLEINRGSVFGFLGPNGAGKTTAIRLLLGLSLPTSGTATIGGLDPWRDTVELHRSIAYVPGEAALWPQLTGGEVIDLLGHLHGSLDPQRRDSLIERFGLDPSKKCRAYSKGNRQKVLLIAALARPSTLLILDEPTSGLDPLMEVEFRHVVNEVAAAGATVLLSSHILSEVQALCSEVGILRAGGGRRRRRLTDRRTSRRGRVARRPPPIGRGRARDRVRRRSARPRRPRRCRTPGATLADRRSRVVPR